jgi:hypothetical protein
MNLAFLKKNPFERYCALSVILPLLVPCHIIASQVLPLADSKRVEASISPDSMNRIAVANDRITQIFGDEGTFESQNDETTGQVFLKPTVENGTKNLSLTLITEQGITQDLTLKPTAASPTTLIFKHAVANPRTSLDDQQKKERQEQGGARGIPSFASNGFDGEMPQSSLLREKDTRIQASSPQGYTYQGCMHQNLITLLKQAVRGQLAPQEQGSFFSFGETNPSRSNPEGLQVSFQKSYSKDAYEVHVFEVENLTKTEIEIQEKSFYQWGDLAISLHRRILPPNAKTLLYVAGLSKALVPETLVSETRAQETLVSETSTLEGDGHD